MQTKTSILMQIKCYFIFLLVHLKVVIDVL